MKKILELSKKPNEIIDKLTVDEIKAIPDAGDGGAVFFGEGTTDEWEKFEREESGMNKIYKKIGL